MKPLNKVIINKDTSFNPVWIMRQAGRYLPEFRNIRKENPNFINLCLNDRQIELLKTRGGNQPHCGGPSCSD